MFDSEQAPANPAPAGDIFDRCPISNPLDTRQHFSAVYTAVAELQLSFKKQPADANGHYIKTLAGIITSARHTHQRQAYFLFRKAANTLRDMMTDAGQPGIAAQAADTLRELLFQTGGSAFRATAEALGTVKLSPGGSRPVKQTTQEEVPRISWEKLVKKSGISPAGGYRRQGRNQLVPAAEKDRVLVVKTASCLKEIEFLHREGWWMARLARDWPLICRRPETFSIPRPLLIDGEYVFEIKDPASGSDTLYGQAFIAPADYFRYPNEPSAGQPGTGSKVRSVLRRGAFILGRLAAHGILHTAPIPLFHNRVQRHRREDRGVYRWTRGGRLDQWLASCRYPNIGATGVRDFEHFVGFRDYPRQLYEYIGSHFLSLVLIAGSYFRNRDTSRKGLDAAGEPVDTRDLFSAALFKAMINDVFAAYYRGFAGSGQPPAFPLDMDRLTARLIEEMGMDHYMTEILRIPEQESMNQAEFVAFLASRGYTQEQIKATPKGQAEITLLTGPHLGAFNSRISLPELTEFAAAATALCVSGRFWASRKQTETPLRGI